MGGPDLVGQLLDGRYRVVTKLGSGAMASVYLARQESLKRQVVVKVPDPLLLRDERFKARFQGEIGSLTKLRHPNVVSVFEAGEVDGIPYLVMEYLPGGSLSDRLREKEEEGENESPRDMLTWLRPIASALDYIHSKNVVHRDVKPGNILFDASGNPFLSDFGIAKALTQEAGDLTQAAGSPGTPGYIPPEVAEGRILPQFDQYSLGACVIRAISGEPPRIAQIREGMEKLLGARLTPDEIRVLNRVTSWEPEDRFESCGAFVEAFAAAVEADDMGDATGAFDLSGAARARLEGKSLEAEESIEMVQAIEIDEDLATGEIVATALPIEEDVPEVEAEPEVKAPPETPAGTREAPLKSPAGAGMEPRPRKLGLPILLAGVAAVILVVGAFLVLGKNGDDDGKGKGNGSGTGVATGTATPESPPLNPPVEPPPVDVLVPDVAVSEPDRVEILTPEESIRFRGTLSVVEGAKVRVGGLTIEPDASGEFSLRVALKEGENPIRVVPLAANGKEGEAKTFTVTRDSIRPRLNLTQAGERQITRQPELVVSGTVEDERPLEVRVQDRATPVGTDGAFRTTVTLEEGRNEIPVVAVDKAGNRSVTKLIEVSLDTVAPSLTFEPPATSLEPRVALRGRSDEEDALVEIGEAKTRVVGGSFALVVDLQPGDNPLILKITDSAGNATQREFDIRRIQRGEGDYGLTAEFMAPQAVAVGESVPVVLTVRNEKDIALEDVRVTVELGGGIETRESSASIRSATAEAGRVSWGGFALGGGDSQKLTLVLRPTKVGDRLVLARVAAKDPEIDREVRTEREFRFDVSPLRLEPGIRAVPAQAELEQSIRLGLRVANPGKRPVHEVRVEVVLPGALVAAGGQSSSISIPVIEAGGEWKSELQVVAKEAGDARASIRVLAAGAENEAGTTVPIARPAPVVVEKPELALETRAVSGNPTGNLETRVRNRGRGVAEGVVVVLELPAGVRAADGTLFPAGSISGRRLTWTVGRLAAGEERLLTAGYELDGESPGRMIVKATARESGGGTASAQCPVTAYKPPELDMNVFEGQDGDVSIEAVRVAAPFYYIVNFVNRGTSTAVVRFAFEPSQDLLRTSTPVGFTGPRGGKEPTEAVKKLDPDASGGFTYELTVRGRRQVYVMIPVKAAISASGRRVGVRVQAVYKAVDSYGNGRSGFSEPLTRYDTTIVNP